MRWGSGASPILYRNMVIVNASEETQALIALDYETRQGSLATGSHRSRQHVGHADSG